MNIVSQLPFNPEKPAVLNLRKSPYTQIIAVGLLQNQTLAKHTTAVPTLLTVLQGKIRFTIEDKTMILNTLDVYPIPENIPHEVLGLEAQNIFMLVKENHIV